MSDLDDDILADIYDIILQESETDEDEDEKLASGIFILLRKYDKKDIIKNLELIKNLKPEDLPKTDEQLGKSTQEDPAIQPESATKMLDILKVLQDVDNNFITYANQQRFNYTPDDLLNIEEHKNSFFLNDSNEYQNQKDQYTKDNNKIIQELTRDLANTNKKKETIMKLESNIPALMDTNNKLSQYLGLVKGLIKTRLFKDKDNGWFTKLTNPFLESNKDFLREVNKLLDKYKPEKSPPVKSPKTPPVDEVTSQQLNDIKEQIKNHNYYIDGQRVTSVSAMNLQKQPAYKEIGNNNQYNNSRWGGGRKSRKSRKTKRHRRQTGKTKRRRRQHRKTKSRAKHPRK
jgi:hypothetical protein